MYYEVTSILTPIRQVSVTNLSYKNSVSHQYIWISSNHMKRKRIVINYYLLLIINLGGYTKDWIQGFTDAK